MSTIRNPSNSGFTAVSSSPPYRVLCVDTGAFGLKLRQLILERKGYVVSTAETVSKALALFKSSDYDLVITDHFLGRETGTAMATEMKRLKPTVPVIVLSLSEVTDTQDAGANAFLSKAEGPELLLAKVIELVARAGAEEPTAILPTVREPFSTEAQRLLLSSIVESSDDAIFSKTMEGTILSWNKAAEKMYGYRAEEVIGKSVSILLPPDRPNEVHDILKRLKCGETVDHFETVRSAKDGHLLTVSLTISSIPNSEGRIIMASTIARDITKAELSEQALRNSERLITAGRMAATLAHEINNPLEAVTNALYLLAESLPTDIRGRELLTIAQDELAKVSRITALTLGLHRSNAERPQQVSVSELIDNVLSLYGRKLRTLGAAIETRYDCDVPVTTFPGELQQVFSNLIVNAADALEKSGDQLCIHVFESVSRKSPAQKGLSITISDNGCGVPVENQAHIFEPFYTTKGSSGTGIGLWVSLGIVHKYGGTMRFRSVVKQGRSGTTFWIFLPIV
jgi:PAS domain S-box-containing protein